MRCACTLECRPASACCCAWPGLPPSHSRTARSLPRPPPASCQVYKALRNGVQPVAVKLLSTSADMRQVRWPLGVGGWVQGMLGVSLLLLPCRHATLAPKREVSLARAQIPHPLGRRLPPTGRISQTGCTSQPLVAALPARPQLALVDFRREIAILKSCRDANVVQFIGASLGPDQTMLVTEVRAGGRGVGGGAALGAPSGRCRGAARSPLA